LVLKFKKIAFDRVDQILMSFKYRIKIIFDLPSYSSDSKETHKISTFLLGKNNPGTTSNYQGFILSKHRK